MSSKVSIVKTDLYDAEKIAESVRKSVELIGGMASIVKPGMKVLLKPNLVAVPQDRLGGAVTRWEVGLPIAEMVKEAGGTAIIAESSAAGVDTRDVGVGHQLAVDDGLEPAVQCLQEGHAVVHLAVSLQ